MWPEAEKRQRHEQLQDLIANVKRNKDIGLNEELDEIMDVEIKFEYPHKFRDGYDSDRGFPIPPFFPENPHFFSPRSVLSGESRTRTQRKLVQDDDVEFNHSWPGLDPHFDGDEARQDLLRYMKN
jgi:hypothetical protein